MKTQLIQTAIAALALATAGFAQSSKPLQVMVPFQFAVGSQTLPAGQYTVSQLADAGAVTIRPAEGPQGAVVLANRVESPGRHEIGKLVFHCYGDRYFLAEVWGTDGSVGSQIPKTHQERELGKNEAPTTILLAAR